MADFFSLGFLRMLESIRTGFGDAVMQFFTYYGEELVFMVVALVFLWCIDKWKGYFLLSVGFVGTILNQFLKLVFRVPRPWVKDPDFSIVESAREGAGGYSFPSGHTQNVAGTFGGIARGTKRRWLQIGSVVLLLVTSFSRMYLGVHTLMDVTVSLLLAAVLVLALYPVFKNIAEHPSRMYWLIGIFVAMALGYLLYVKLWPFPAEAMNENYDEGLKNAYSLLGALLGLAVAFPLEQKYIQYDVRAIWWAQVLKVGLGLAGALAVKEGLKLLMNLFWGAYLFPNAIRYFFLVLFAGALWPMTFRWFGKLGRK